jgi:sugar phosphate isomerase/epimerase
MLRTHKDRIHLLHVKDRKPGFSTSQDLNSDAEHFTEVGTGMVHWSPILAQARAQGIKHFFVEQDECARPPLESLKISYQNLNRLLNGGASAKQTA